MTEPDARIVELFSEEANERLDRMVEILLAVEARQEPADAIPSLFREAHSLKGTAGMLGFDDVGAIAHALEDLLAEVRGRGEQIPATAAEAMLRATDAMRRSIAGDPTAGEETIVELRALQDAPPAGPTNAESAPAQPDAAGPGPASLGGSVRVPAAKVDRLLDAVGETVLHHRALEHLLAPQADERIEGALGDGELLLSELQDAVLELRTLPLASITGRFARFVRDLAVAAGKDVQLSMSGVDTQLDRLILEGLSESLVHLLRNAIAHGIEPPDERVAAGKPRQGHLTLHAEQRGGRVAIELTDDGRGVPEELLRKAAERGTLADVLTEAGFSTAQTVTDVAGRGVGLDAVRRHAESLGGSLEAASEPGRGTTFTLTLPLTLAIQHVLLVECAGQPFGLPLASIAEVVTVEDTVSLEGRQALELRGETVRLSDLATALGAAAGELAKPTPAVIVVHAGTRVALACDQLLGEEEVVVKGLGSILNALPGYLGAAILGDGRIALIADPATVTAQGVRRPVAQAPAAVEEVRASRILVVDDQFTVRELQRSILEAHGYRVTTAKDGREALQHLGADADIALVVTDLQMPEMDGLALLRHIRKESERASLPVVVLTSQGSETDRRRGLEEGADAYLVKDEFDQRALLDTVERLIGR